MGVYSFGFSATAQLSNGNIGWTIPGGAGANTGSINMPPVNALTSNSLTSTQGTESPPPSIPTGATILGIVLSIAAYSSAATTFKDIQAQIFKNGVACANKAHGAFLGTSDSSTLYGSPTDLWGTTWVPGDIANIDWQFQIENFTSNSGYAHVDGVSISVYTLDPSGGGASGPDMRGLQVFPRGTIRVL